MLTKQIIQQEIINFLDKNTSMPNSRTLFVKKYISEITKITNFLPDEARTIERLYIIHHKLIESDIKCPMCSKNKKFYTFTSGYNLTCSQSCSTKYQQKYIVDREEVTRKMMNTTQNRTVEEKQKSIIQKHKTSIKRHGENYKTVFGKVGYENAIAAGTYVSGLNEIRKTDTKRWKLIHHKATQTLLNDIDENGNNHYDRVHIQKMNDIDENGNNHYDRVHQQRLDDVDNNGLNSYERNTLNNYKTGLWTDPKDKSDLELYRWQVQRTMLLYKNEISKLLNIELRGHANKGMYHLDHRFSIIEGFKHNIPPYIIGSIHNLEMITARNNLVKNRKCSITTKELFDLYF